MKKGSNVLIYTGDIDPLEHGGLWYNAKTGDAVELTGMHASADFYGGLAIFGGLDLDPEDVLSHHRAIGADEETARLAAAAVEAMLNGEDYDPYALGVAVDICRAWYGLDYVRGGAYFTTLDDMADELNCTADEAGAIASKDGILVGDEVFSAIADYLGVDIDDVLGAI